MIFDMTKRKGGGDSIAYTPVDRLTVLSNSTAGYDNKFIVNNCAISGIKKIIAKVKYANYNSIWFACKKQGKTVDTWGSSSPYVNRSTGNDCTAVDGGVDADGYHEITVTINSNDNYLPCFGGAWPDSTFGKNVSFKSVKGYDSNDAILFDLMPGVLKNGEVVMINQTAGIALSANLYKNNVVVAGEVV